MPPADPQESSRAGALSQRLEDFDYPLPPARIAQTPLADRDSSKLLVLNRWTGEIQHRIFRDICDYLNPGDVLVLNDTRVTAMRLFIERPEPGGTSPLPSRWTGEGARSPRKRFEVFLIGRVPAAGADDGLLWHALVRPGKKMLPGTSVDAGHGIRITVVESTDDRGGRLLRIDGEPGVDVAAELERLSVAPLPPYISTELKGSERERYQTVYAAHGGSAAAPTAGLHFTEPLLDRVAATGVSIARVTLDVGLGTFRPIESEDIRNHRMHAERVSLSEETAEIINSARGRIIAVGTTSTRTLEASAAGRRRVAARDGETSLYVTPGFEFQVVDALITNFHMPRSTLLVLVSAFAGRDRVLNAYSEALANDYRFLSFGDAMFICN